MQVGTFNKEKALIGAFYLRILWKLNNSAKFRCQLSSSLSSSGSGVAAGSAHSVGVAVSRGPETGVSVATPPPAGVCILQLHGCCHETRGFVTRDRVTVRVVRGLVVRAGWRLFLAASNSCPPAVCGGWRDHWTLDHWPELLRYLLSVITTAGGTTTDGTTDGDNTLYYVAGLSTFWLLSYYFCTKATYSILLWPPTLKIPLKFQIPIQSEPSNISLMISSETPRRPAAVSASLGS